jgi:hypothetical protein
VFWAWKRNVGTHGAHSSSAPPKPISPSASSSRRVCGAATAISPSHVKPQLAAKNSAQLCVYISAASATANAAAQRRRTSRRRTGLAPAST